MTWPRLLAHLLEGLPIVGGALARLGARQLAKTAGWLGAAVAVLVLLTAWAEVSELVANDAVAAASQLASAVKTAVDAAFQEAFERLAGNGPVG